MRNPNYITNPKTIRKYEKARKELEELEVFAKENGCIIIKQSNTNYTFSKDGQKSGYGFDTREEALMYIFRTYRDYTK